MKNIRVFILVLGLSLILAGCGGQGEATGEGGEGHEEEMAPQEGILPPPQEEPQAPPQMGELGVWKFSVEHDTPGTRQYGVERIQDVAVDLDGKMYVIADRDDYMILIYVNGTRYRATTLGEDCTLAIVEREFYDMDDYDLGLWSFVMVESLREQQPEMYANLSAELEGNYYLGNGLYSIEGSGLEDSVLKKYGSSYFGHNITYVHSGLRYNYVFNEVEEITEAEFEDFFGEKAEMIKAKECENYFGQENPFE